MRQQTITLLLCCACNVNVTLSACRRALTSKHTLYGSEVGRVELRCRSQPDPVSYWAGVNDIAAELMQYLVWVGGGPSSNTWPRWAPHCLHVTSVRFIPAPPASQHHHHHHHHQQQQQQLQQLQQQQLSFSAALPLDVTCHQLFLALITSLAPLTQYALTPWHSETEQYVFVLLQFNCSNYGAVHILDLIWRRVQWFFRLCDTSCTHTVHTDLPKSKTEPHKNELFVTDQIFRTCSLGDDLLAQLLNVAWTTATKFGEDKG